MNGFKVSLFVVLLNSIFKLRLIGVTGVTFSGFDVCFYSATILHQSKSVNYFLVKPSFKVEIICFLILIINFKNSWKARFDTAEAHNFSKFKISMILFVKLLACCHIATILWVCCVLVKTNYWLFDSYLKHQGCLVKLT